MSDPAKYRSVAEHEVWKARDPIPNFAKRLIEEGITTSEQLEGVQTKAREVVQEAVQFAEESPWPEDEEVFNDIYV